MLVKVFRKILEFIDKPSCELLGNIPDLVFIRHFMNNFQEMKAESVCNSVLDLLYLLGSGSQTATISEPEYVNVSDQRPLCRSS